MDLVHIRKPELTFCKGLWEMWYGEMLARECDNNESPAHTTANVALGGTRIDERTRSATNELGEHSLQPAALCVRKTGVQKLHLFDRQLQISDRRNIGAQNFNFVPKFPGNGGLPVPNVVFWRKIFLSNGLYVLERKGGATATGSREWIRPILQLPGPPCTGLSVVRENGHTNLSTGHFRLDESCVLRQLLLLLLNLSTEQHNVCISDTSRSYLVNAESLLASNRLLAAAVCNCMFWLGFDRLTPNSSFRGCPCPPSNRMCHWTAQVYLPNAS